MTFNELTHNLDEAVKRGQKLIREAELEAAKTLADGSMNEEAKKRLAFVDGYTTALKDIVGQLEEVI